MILGGLIRALRGVCYRINSEYRGRMYCAYYNNAQGLPPLLADRCYALLRMSFMRPLDANLIFTATLQTYLLDPCRNIKT